VFSITFCNPLEELGIADCCILLISREVLDFTIVGFGSWNLLYFVCVVESHWNLHSTCI
jgi:hypothetical protein